MSIFTIISISVAVIILWVYISNYNTLNRRKNQIQNSLSSLDALFIKRHEMIPNLVSVVKQYTAYESDVLDKITKLRQPQAGSKGYLNEGETDKLLKQLMVQVENYPELKANQQFNNLQYSINECEEQIAAGRRYVSSSITSYNNQVTTFPGNIIANMCGMKVHEWQTASDVQRENADVGDMFK